MASINIGRGHSFGAEAFHRVVFEGCQLSVDEATRERLRQTSRFIDYLLEQEIPVYGLTTGFADLRDRPVNRENAAELSYNILQSHDAGIGPDLPDKVTLGAMAVRANSLAKGCSGFHEQSLDLLVAMINKRIIPCIPNTGSLGASGDLALLARLGRAMQGHEVPVMYKGEKVLAKEALAAEGLAPFIPRAKEGLALTNGTAFMASMIAIAYSKEIHLLENMIAGIVLFLNAIEAIDAPFYESIQNARGQVYQKRVAKLFLDALKDSPFVDKKGVQNDYSIRCLPQILGPRFEVIFYQFDAINREMDAITDNPLIFKGSEISADVHPERILQFEDEPWVVLSGGNFHGENITTIADIFLMNNAKIALTIERHLTYMLNPFRNKNHLPHYLITEPGNVGLLSGYMIPQYTANALAQKMAQLGMPASLFNITSANESEDVVSYGSTAAQTLLQQLELFGQFNVIYLTMAAQAYAIKREQYGRKIPSSSLAEKLFAAINANGSFPTRGDSSFKELYKEAAALSATTLLREIQGFPLLNGFLDFPVRGEHDSNKSCPFEI